MWTSGRAAKNIVNDSECALNKEHQEKLVEICDKEQVKVWADCVRACDRKDNGLLLRRMELTKNTKFFR